MINRNLKVMKDHNELIKEYKSLKHQIKVYELHADIVKKQVIEHHLTDTDTLYCPEGLVICTYKSSIRADFQTKKFKESEPVLYDKYLDLKEIFTFLVK
jgi:predicted phage-related endonuclease